MMTKATAESYMKTLGVNINTLLGGVAVLGIFGTIFIAFDDFTDMMKNVDNHSTQLVDHSSQLHSHSTQLAQHDWQIAQAADERANVTGVMRDLTDAVNQLNTTASTQQQIQLRIEQKLDQLDRQQRELERRGN